MITAKDIQKKLNKAIRDFGRYSYEDKGASEVMDIDSIVEELLKIEDTQTILEILETLDKKELNSVLVRELVGYLMDGPNEDLADELAEKDTGVIVKYC